MSKQPTKKEIEAALIKAMPIWQKKPLSFIEDMWQLTPQPLKPEHEAAAKILIEQHELQSIRPEWFDDFQRGKHITWQQWLIFLSIEAAISGKSHKRISVASAHGIGKSCSMSLTIIWFLFTHYLAQIAVTAPTSKQLFDVLWKELSIWISRMPSFWQPYFEWQSTYIRMKQQPQEWFASAKTAKKDSTEALAGVHGEHVMVLADEASGVPNEVFDTMEGSLTEKDILVFLISNPTRLSGYFYETHNKPEIKRKWQTLAFDNISSPVVREDYNQDIIDKHGKNSDEYRIRVLGKFPIEDAVDEKGYTSLIGKDKIIEIDQPPIPPNKDFWIGTPVMGIDPAGEGRDETVWVVRDQFKAAVVLREKISNDKTIANRTRTLALLHGVQGYNIWVDSFGIGSNVAAEIAKDWCRINALNVGDNCTTEQGKNIYLNRKAENYMRLKKALTSGFELVRDKKWCEDLTAIKFRRNERGRIQIMPKRELKKDYKVSPDSVEALMLTFSEEFISSGVSTMTRSQRENAANNIKTNTLLNKTKNNLHSAI